MPKNGGLPCSMTLWTYDKVIQLYDSDRSVNVAKGFKNPTFTERANASAAAKRALVERHKAAPKPDPAELALPPGAA